MNKIKLAVLIVSVWLSGCSAAGSLRSAAFQRVPNYLTQVQIDAGAIPPPPEAGSPRDKADLAAVLDWNAKRTPQQTEAARAQADETFESLFGEVSPFSAPLPVEVGAFFSRVENDVVVAVAALKRRFGRDRPFIADPSIVKCSPAGNHSYPSGHTTLAYTYAMLLTELVPSRKEQFEDYAAQAGINRVICGVHYPSDVEAGRALAPQIYNALSVNPTFAADMTEMRSFVRR